MPNNALASRAAVAATAALLAACGPHAPSGAFAPAGSADRVALAESAWRPPRGQRCADAPLPAVLPAVAQLVDTGAVAAILVGQPLPDGTYALMSLKFDSAGEATRAVVIESSLTSADRNRVALAVANALRTQPRAATPWGVRLRVDASTPPRLRVGRAEWCDAAPSDRGPAPPSASEKLGTARTTDPAGPTIVQEPARWQVVVDTAGRVASATLLTATHYPDLAHSARESLMRLRFHPALDDRVPVAVVDTIDYAISGVGRQ
jgi:hypothetical protein